MHDEEFIAMSIRNLIYLVRELEPDLEWREHYNVDGVIEDAEKSLLLLTKEK